MLSLCFGKVKRNPISEAQRNITLRETFLVLEYEELAYLGLPQPVAGIQHHHHHHDRQVAKSILYFVCGFFFRFDSSKLLKGKIFHFHVNNNASRMKRRDENKRKEKEKKIIRTDLKDVLHATNLNFFSNFFYLFTLFCRFLLYCMHSALWVDGVCVSVYECVCMYVIRQPKHCYWIHFSQWNCHIQIFKWKWIGIFFVYVCLWETKQIGLTIAEQHPILREVLISSISTWFLSYFIWIEFTNLWDYFCNCVCDCHCCFHHFLIYFISINSIRKTKSGK